MKAISANMPITLHNHTHSLLTISITVQLISTLLIAMRTGLQSQMTETIIIITFIWRGTSKIDKTESERQANLEVTYYGLGGDIIEYKSTLLNQKSVSVSSQ